MGRVTVLLITLLFLEIGLSSSQNGGWHGVDDIKERQIARPQWGIHKIIRRSVEVAIDHGLVRPPSDIAASPGVVKK